MNGKKELSHHLTVLHKTLRFFLVFVSLSGTSCLSGKSAISFEVVSDTVIKTPDRPYFLGPGDEIEISYFSNILPQNNDYKINIGDVLEINFDANPEFNHTVKVLPNGIITLSPKGDFKVLGFSTSQLSEEISERYRDIIKIPIITVSLVEYSNALKNFMDGIQSNSQGQSRRVRIRPDGNLSLPLLDDIQCMGITLPELKTKITAQYDSLFPGVAISLDVSDVRNNVVYVLGEVQRPNMYRLDAPTTLTQILSRSGVNMNTAGMRSVIVMSRNDEHKPVVQIVNATRVLRSGNIGKDLILTQYDIIYVPKNNIANVGLFVNQYINAVIPNIFRVGIGFNYDLSDYLNQ